VCCKTVRHNVASKVLEENCFRVLLHGSRRKPVKCYKDFWPRFCASHVDHRILVALGELAGVKEFGFAVPEHNCIFLWSALCMMFSLNTIVIRVWTSKRLIFVDVPSLLLHSYVFCFVMIIEDIYSALPQPKVSFLLWFLWLSFLLHYIPMSFSLPVLLFYMNCSGEADITKWIIGVEIKIREGFCKSLPGDAESCKFISVEVFNKDS
jgi:hypothetical protein